MSLHAFCRLAVFAFVFASLAPVLCGQAANTRTLKICVAADAPPEVRASAERIRAGVSGSPLLSLLAANGVSLEDSARLHSGPIEARAYHHLVLVGLPSDPLIQLAWQHEAAVEEGGFYIFGFGHLHGDIGYIESDRNPFLHSSAIAAAPYETEIITVTGSTPAGVQLAAEAFLTMGLINGVVAAPGWTRPQTTILDRDPLTIPLEPVAFAPAFAGKATRVGITQAGENEYRDVLEDTGIKPESIWRVKYYEPGVWDQAASAEASSPAEFLNGLHRRATGNTLWIARFASVEDAAAAAQRIAAAARLNRHGAAWSGPGPSGNLIADPQGVPEEPAPSLMLWTSANTVFLSTVPKLIPKNLQQASGR
jgi:hypothetical protein